MTETLTKTDLHDEELDDTHEQYVTFYLGDEIFGFSMTSVLEIIRLPDTVQVPLTPSALVGLANLRGSILPVLDLRRALGLEGIVYNDLTRVVVSDVGTPIGLIVDRVSQVMSVESTDIDNSGKVQSRLNADMLKGVIKGDSSSPMIQLLDIKKLISQEFSEILSTAVNQGTITEEQHIEAEEDDQLVSFVVQEQEYAFNLLEVEEIVRMPESITKVPRSNEHFLGLINLRGRLLPIVSLRRMFELDEVELDENTRIVVVTLTSPLGQKDSIGLLVDDVIEVLRVSHDEQEKIPSLFMNKDESSDIESICRLDDGHRLVSILSADTLFTHPVVQAAIEARNVEEEDEVKEEEFLEEVDDDSAQLVVFKLGEQEYGVSIDDVQEITRLPEKMEKVPKTADFIEGMVNLRGTVLPVLDMRTRFDMEKMERNHRQRIIVLSFDGQHTGFIVDSIAEVIRLLQTQIEAAPNLSDDQSRIMGHVVNLKESKRMIQVLTVKELLSDKELTAMNNEGELH